MAGAARSKTMGILLVAALTALLAVLVVFTSPPVARAQSPRARPRPVCTLTRALQVLRCELPGRGRRAALVAKLRRTLDGTTKIVGTVVDTKRSLHGLVEKTGNGLQETLASTSELLPETATGCDVRTLLRGRACGQRIPALIAPEERDEEILGGRFATRPQRTVEKGPSRPQASFPRTGVRPEPRSAVSRYFEMVKPQDDSDHQSTEEVVDALRRFAFPLGLAVMVVLFLAIQGRLDRKDPKLALAPVTSGDDLLSFR